MPKIIFTSRYLRDAPTAQLENYVRYISTREGVEKIDESKRNLPATRNQQQLIQQLIRDIPASRDMLEYADFLLRPTIGNASEFISCALEQNLDLIAKRENYVDYIANRPRVERVGEHGLFTDAGKPVVLSRVQQEVTAHKGVVWTHVVSLRREDAARLGYDSAEQWMALLRSKRAMLCRHMKINSENLRWYAAFHNEGHHPHVHLMVYSAKDNDGYLMEKSIEAMRSELAHDIFRQDFAHIYEQQNQTRADLKTGATDVMREMMDALRSGTMASPEIEKRMEELSRRLQNTKGKKVYGYLKRDVKNLIDQIVDELEKDSRVSALYQAWEKWNNEILLTYQKEAPPLPPLSKQPQFKSIKNMVIAEALKLGSHHFTFEDEEMPDSVHAPDEMPILEISAEENVPEWQEQEFVSTEQSPRNSRNSHGGPETKWWSKNYKKARQYLYGSEEIKSDFVEAFRLFLQEAESGNALAMYDLGRMLADGLGREIDMVASQEWKNRLQRRNSVRISSTGLAKCMQLDLVQNKVMNLRRNGSPRRQIQTTSMRSIPWQDFITADRVWSRSILVHFSCIKTLQNREILMPAMSWQRCIVAVSVPPKIVRRLNSISGKHLLAFAGWRKKAMMISCSTVWDRCCTQVRVQSVMIR